MGALGRFLAELLLHRNDKAPGPGMVLTLESRVCGVLHANARPFSVSDWLLERRTLRITDTDWHFSVASSARPRDARNGAIIRSRWPFIDDPWIQEVVDPALVLSSLDALQVTELKETWQIEAFRRTSASHLAGLVDPRCDAWHGRIHRATGLLLEVQSAAMGTELTRHTVAWECPGDVAAPIGSL